MLRAQDILIRPVNVVYQSTAWELLNSSCAKICRKQRGTIEAGVVIALKHLVQMKASWIDVRAIWSSSSPPQKVMNYFRRSQGRRRGANGVMNDSGIGCFFLY